MHIGGGAALEAVRRRAAQVMRSPAFGIVAITPPNQFPQAVWDELVKQGKLKHAGKGTYELVKD